jgi:hypothetical protein
MRAIGRAAGGSIARVFALVLAAVAIANPAGAKEPEPTGYGAAQFGMSVAQVEKIFPGMRELQLGEKLAAPAVYAPSIRRFVLADQKLAGSEKPVTVELRFWKDQFWLYVTYFEEAYVDAVMAGLVQRFGPPGHGQPDRPLWAGDRTVILGEFKRGYVTIQDNGVSQQAQTWFTEALEATRHERRLPLKAVTPAPSAPAGPTGVPATKPPGG